MTNLEMIKPKSVQNIITKFCFTIGMIPTSYKLSLTYEEQILAIGQYLEETVYPAINNNAEALAELQGLFSDLKNYVENYFNNLDIQEEINNKLDEMVTDGSLQEIIISYLKLNGMLTFNTISDMKNSTNLIEGSFACTYGYHSINDGGQAFYKVRKVTNEDDINEGNIIALLDNTLIAELIPFNNVVNPLQFGTLPNTTNYTNQLINCLNYAHQFNLKIDLLNKSFLIEEPITLDNLTVFNGEFLQNNFKITLKNNVKCFNITFNSNLRDSSILLDDTLNLTFENCTIMGGIHCITHASNTIINNSKFKGHGYHLLFNDQDQNRISEDTIGQNLTVSNCTFIIDDNVHIGDIIEINAPKYGFNMIKILNNNAYLDKNINNPQPYDPASIGFGFANCSNININNNILDSVSSGNGAIHCEVCKDVMITNNQITNSKNLLYNEFFNAMMLINNKNVNILNNNIKDYPICLFMVSDIDLNENYIISNNILKGYHYGIYGNNAENFNINNNMIILQDINSTISPSLEGIFFYQNVNPGMQNSNISNNSIYCSVAQTGSGNYSYGIHIIDPINNTISNNNIFGVNPGINRSDFLGTGFKVDNRNNNNTNFILSSPSVQNYYDKNTNSVILDGSNGIFYKYFNDKWQKSLILFDEDQTDFVQTSVRYMAATLEKRHGYKVIYNYTTIGVQLLAETTYTLFNITEERARPLIKVRELITATDGSQFVLEITTDGDVNITPQKNIDVNARPHFYFMFI